MPKLSLPRKWVKRRRRRPLRLGIREERARATLRNRRTYSLRRTNATPVSRRNGNLRAAQLLLGRTKIESTVRYLGIEVDDASAIAEQVDV